MKTTIKFPRKAERMNTRAKAARQQLDYSAPKVEMIQKVT